uniref:Uncharacterized protein n=2 Tax=Cannabis sativa TaxID=3483 RepID=A0A803QSZ5_CANSA
MHRSQLQPRLLSPTYLLSASTCSLELLILLVPSFMRLTNILIKTPSTMVLLKLLRLVDSSALNLFSLLLLELLFLFSLSCGFMVKYSTFRRKPRELPRWKLGPGPLMHQWMSGFRELHILSRFPANQRRRSRLNVVIALLLRMRIHRRFKLP